MAREPRRSARLDQPREVRRALLPRRTTTPRRSAGCRERIARFIGTGRFLVYMTVFVVVWLVWNVVAPDGCSSTTYPFIFLTLILSLQASYAAPLILLAQNRQADRDRVSTSRTAARAERNIADTEYLTRELAALRIALGEVATRDFLRSELQPAARGARGAAGRASRARRAPTEPAGSPRRRRDLGRPARARRAAGAAARPSAATSLVVEPADRVARDAAQVGRGGRAQPVQPGVGEHGEQPAGVARRTPPARPGRRARAGRPAGSGRCARAAPARPARSSAAAARAPRRAAPARRRRPAAAGARRAGRPRAGG